MNFIFFLSISPCLGRLFGLKLSRGLLFEAQWHAYIRSICKYAGKVVDSFTAPASIWFPMLYSIFTRAISDQNQCITTISVLELISPILPVLTEFKSVQAPLGVIYYFPPTSPFLQTNIICLYYSITISMACILTRSIHWSRQF